MAKVKVYTLMLSETFPKGHIREGQPTGFKSKLYAGQKAHTIRANYELWKKRAEKINSGLAMLSIRQWTGKPYRTKAVEIRRLDHLYVQRIKMSELNKNGYLYPYTSDTKTSSYPAADIACNDGLSLPDFKSWFADYDLSKDMAVLHFNKKTYL